MSASAGTSAAPAAGDARGAAGAGDVRPHRAALRPDELGDDRRAAPRLAPPGGRPRRARARATARSTSPPAPATWRWSSPRAWRPGGEVIGCDFAERMLELARVKPVPAGAAVRFEAANALALPYADGEFAAATVGFGARNFSDLDRGLREMARVVRPGGRVVVLEITQPTRPPLSTFFGLWFDRLVPALGRVAGDSGCLRVPAELGPPLPGPGGAGGAAWRRPASTDVRYLLTAGGIIAAARRAAAVSSAAVDAVVSAGGGRAAGPARRGRGADGRAGPRPRAGARASRRRDPGRRRQAAAPAARVPGRRRGGARRRRCSSPPRWRSS